MLPIVVGDIFVHESNKETCASSETVQMDKILVTVTNCKLNETAMRRSGSCCCCTSSKDVTIINTIGNGEKWELENTRFSERNSLKFTSNLEYRNVAPCSAAACRWPMATWVSASLCYCAQQNLCCDGAIAIRHGQVVAVDQFVTLQWQVCQLSVSESHSLRLSDSPLRLDFRWFFLDLWVTVIFFNVSSQLCRYSASNAAWQYWSPQWRLGYYWAGLGLGLLFVMIILRNVKNML